MLGMKQLLRRESLVPLIQLAVWIRGVGIQARFLDGMVDEVI